MHHRTAKRAAALQPDRQSEIRELDEEAVTYSWILPLPGGAHLASAHDKRGYEQMHHRTTKRTTALQSDRQGEFRELKKEAVALSWISSAGRRAPGERA